MKLFFINLLFLIVVAVFPLTFVWAVQEGNQPGGIQEGTQREGGFTLPNPLGNTTSFAVIMEKLADIAIKIGLPLVVIFMIYAGFLFVSAGGNEDKITAAKTTFFWAIVGALLIIGSKALAIAIQNLAEKLK